MIPRVVVLSCLLFSLAPMSAFAAPLIRSTTGTNSAEIAPALDLFRADLGGSDNGAGAPAASGRREINWDGVPDNFAAPNNLPNDFFNVNSPRGVVFSTPGTAVQVSANGAQAEFANIDPAYPGYFTTNSPQRLFTAVGSTITDVQFFIPGTNEPAAVTGFGAVFTDVDTNATTMQFFGPNGVMFGTYTVPHVAGNGNQTLSFLGISFNQGERITRVRITCGNQTLAAGNTAGDTVVMDDFIYAEPQVFPVRNVTSGKVFPSIQTAIVDPATLDGHVIEAKPGTYSEQVTVNKGITLRGAKAGVDARDPSRGTAESIVNGAVLNGLRTTSFHVTANNVRIDGFTVQEAQHGNQHGGGIVLAPATSGAQIRNNVIRDNRIGLFLSNLDTKNPLLIERNRFDSNNFDPNNNPGSNVGFGIYSTETLAGGPLRNVVINENTFLSHKSAAIALSSSDANAPQLNIVIANNVMSGNGAGIDLKNTISSTITRNTIENSTGYQIGIGGGTSTLTLDENVIQGGQTHGIVLSDAFTNTANSNIEVNCNFFAGNAQSAFVLVDGYSGSLNATGNWWGSSTGPTISSNPGGTGQPITDPAGQINYSGFLTSAADPQPLAPGFQCDPGATLYGVDASNNLLTFRSVTPGTVSAKTVTGLQPSESIRGIDFRPTTGELFAIGSGNRLYVIDPATAAATLRAQLSNVTLSGNGLGMAFDPVADLTTDASLRVITDTDQNVRINVVTGAGVSDTAINPGAVSVDAIAYSNSDVDPQTGSALLGYDFSGNRLVKTGSPNGGTFVSSGASGYTAQNEVNMDVQTTGGRNVVFTSLQRFSGITHLYTMKVANGLLVPLGEIGEFKNLAGGLAVAPVGAVQFSSSSFSVNEAAGTATITLTRTGGSAGYASVNVQANDGSATSPTDYAGSAQVVTFNPGETSRTVNVSIVSDALDEADETINLVLAFPTDGATLGNPSSAVLTIIDKPTPTISIAPSQSVRAGGQLTASATLSGGSALTGSVTFAFYGPGDAGCGTPLFTSSVPVNGDGTYTSAPYSPPRTGTYRIAVTYSGDDANNSTAIGCGDPSAAVEVTPATALANIATRLLVQPGDNVLIGGITITGSLPKRMIVRAIGPSADVPGALSDPQLQLFAGDELVTGNDNWRDAPNQQEIIDTTLAPPDDRESAILITLNPGQYTAVVSGVNGDSGVGLVDAYDLDRTVDSKFANIATRGLVQTGDDVMIGGLTVVGDTQQTVLVRAIGPSLPIEGRLANPTLDLVDANGDILLSNDNWRDTQEAQIQATSIPPPDNLESAILATLAPAQYTAVVRGSGETTGVALVEVYALD